MGKNKYIETNEVISELNIELPFKKNKDGLYVIFPNHIGGKNCLRNLHASKNSVGYIYFLNIVGTNKYKIGVSTNPKRRLRDISSYIPFELKLLSIHKLNTPYEIEQDFINLYSDNLIKNEWFEFDLNTVKKIMISLHNLEYNEQQ